MSAAHDTASRPARRGILAAAAGALGLAALGELIWVAVGFLQPRRPGARRKTQLVVAGPVDRFDPGSVTAFPEGRFYLVRLEDGGFLALDRTCTHLGCTVPWVASREQFVCPCHASVFDLRGDVVTPPAPRALDHLPVRIENGVVKIEIGRPMRRERFEPGQVARA